MEPAETEQTTMDRVHTADSPPSPPQRGPKPPKPLTPTGEKLLAGASERLRRGITKDIAIGMKAAGIPTLKVAEALDISTTQLAKEMAGAKEIIAHYREKLKVLKIEKAHQVEGKLWARFEREIDNGEAKGVDALARAIHASEKVQSAVAGEGQKIDVTGIPKNPTVDIKMLIQNLLNA